jgi:hypothetical protein
MKLKYSAMIREAGRAYQRKIHVSRPATMVHKHESAVNESATKLQKLLISD